MSGKLDISEPRLGWFIDGNENTPHTATMLVDNGSSITLTVPWQHVGSQYERWFHSMHTSWSDDPNRERYDYQVPNVLWFNDTNGVVCLVGCTSSAVTNNLNLSVGQGQVDVTYAVLGTGGSADYSTINGLRSNMPGLSDWMSLRSLTQEIERDDEGLVEALTLRLNSPEPVTLSPSMNLRVRPAFSIHKAPRSDITTVEELLQIDTQVEDATGWHEHLTAHNSVRDLVSISGWHPFGYASQSANRSDDPQVELTGKSVGQRWAEVRTHVIHKHAPLNRHINYLFLFEHVRQEGFHRWLEIREQFQRGINPLLETIDPRDSTLEAALTQSCIGLDGIGYQLALDDGLSQAKANNESHRERLVRVANDVAITLPFDVHEWSCRAADAYNGVKHANRDMSDTLTMANTLREIHLAFRLWIGSRIGAPSEALETNLARDRMARPYTLLT